MEVKDVVSKFDSQIKVLSQMKANFCSCPEKDFSRNRKLSFEDIICSVLSFGGGTLTNEILKFKRYSPDAPSTSAFIQQRRKISAAAFSTLFSSISQIFDQDLRHKGFRLIAVDGSHVHVPSNPQDLDSYVKCRNDERPHSEFHLNAMIDLLQGIYTDAVIQKYRTQNEDKALIDMIERSEIKNAIAVCDRGYESYNNMAHLQTSGWKYLMRIKEPGRYGIASGFILPNTNEYDFPIQLALTRRKNKETKDLLKDKNHYRYIPSGVNFDYLPAKSKHHDPVEFFVLDFRIVRIEVGEGKYELLITNLPKADFSTTDLKELYAMRWGIETSFRALKYIVGMLTFHARKSEFVMQEIYAKLIMYNMTRIISNCVETPKRKRKYQYRIRFSVAVNIVKSLLLRDISPPNAIILIGKNLTPVRPNRVSPRKPRAKAQIQFSYRIA